MYIVQTTVVLLSNVGAECSDWAGFGAYRGKDSTGRVNRKPFSSAAFEPCLPNPSPLFEVPVVDLDTPLSPVSCRGMCWCVSKTLDMKRGGSTPTARPNSIPFSTPLRTGAGRTSLARSFQAVIERRGLDFSRKISPTRMFKHPREKRKKAETRVKSLTWWERIAAPSLSLFKAGLGHYQSCTDKGKRDSQALNDAESADAKIVSKDGEVPVEESRGPADFGEEEDNNLSDDQKPVEHGPEYTSRLVGNGRVAMNRVRRRRAWTGSKETYGT